MAVKYDIQNDTLIADGFIETGVPSPRLTISKTNIVTVSGQLIEDNSLTKAMVVSKEGNLTVKSIAEVIPNPEVVAWEARTGGTLSQNTKDAATTFLAALDAAGIRSKMLHVNIIAPDFLSASLTPLIVTYGKTTYSPIGSNASYSLTVNGIADSPGGGNSMLDTGFNPALAYANDTSAGITAYKFATVATNPCAGCQTAPVGAGGAQFLIFNGEGHAAGISYMYDLNSRRWSYDWHNDHGGYFSGNRTAVNAHTFYAANSNFTHAAYGNTTTANAAARPNLSCYFLGYNDNGSPGGGDGQRRSFLAFHLGLTESESLAFYNAIVALRTKLGGGLV